MGTRPVQKEAAERAAVLGRAVPASEIKRCGISVCDAKLKEGPVYVIKNNRIEYIVLNRAQYEEFLEEAEGASDARVRESLEDIAAGRGRSVTADELIAELGLNG